MAIVLNGDTGISSIGTLTGVTSISSASANTPVVMQDSGSNTNTCRAWVNFNGTGTVAIRGSFNISSVTDNGTGDFTLVFATSLPDANYSWGFGGNNSVDTASTNTVQVINTQTSYVTSSSFRFISKQLAGGGGLTSNDLSIVTVEIFR
jgi:hypothetical protein